MTCKAILTAKIHLLYPLALFTVLISFQSHRHSNYFKVEEMHKRLQRDVCYISARQKTETLKNA